MDLSRIATSKGRLDLASAPEGFDALVTAELARARKDATLFVARDASRADAFVGALSFFEPSLPVLRFPAWDCLPYDRISPSPGVAAARMAALFQLAARKAAEGPLLVVATLPARAPARAAARRHPPRPATRRAPGAT